MLIPKVKKTSPALWAVHRHIALHEAGHAIVAEVLGLTVLNVEVSIWHRERRHISCCRFAGWRTQPTPTIHAAILSAGDAAEDHNLLYPKAAMDIYQGMQWGESKPIRPVSDDQQIAEIASMQQAVTGKDPSSKPQKASFCFAAWRMAREVISDRRRELNTLADELMAYGVVEGEQVRKILQLTTGCRVAACSP
jgi:hypothetical protein